MLRLPIGKQLFSHVNDRPLSLGRQQCLKDYTEQDVSVIRVPCAGGVSAGMMLETMLKGAEKVIIAGCHNGNCRSGNGSISAVSQDP